MPPRGSLSHWLTANGDALQEHWAHTFKSQLERLIELPERTPVFRRAHELLLTLAELMHEPVSSVGADERVKSALQDLKLLQSEERLSSMEIVLLLSTVRDALKQVSVTVPAPGPDNRELGRGSEEASITQLANLLGRLGQVFFQVSSNPLADVEPQHDTNVEYALRYERARQMAITDWLTGLHNFGYFRERLTEECRRAERYQRLLSLILFDLDHFKQYNDTHGHPAGNDVLKKVAGILRREARETDLVARYGGEELVIVLPETNRKTAWDVAERIRHQVSVASFSPLDLDASERVTLSAGVATYPVDATHDEELIARADVSLYAAKSSGRNRVVAYEPPDKVNIVYHPDAWVRTVALVGSFNNWDKDADPMRQRPDGAFEFVISLNPGDYRYKFVLNGSAWIPDPTNPQTQPDNMGGVNSLLRVKAPTDLGDSQPG